jgi:pyruvate dehydrogenase E1 component alpha subunit
LYAESKIRGFLHLYIGEEAVAAGVMSCLQPADGVLATYREHGHALLRGVSAESIMSEMFGRTTGCSGGRGGSMHLFDETTRFFGGNAIVGGHLPLAVGLGLADQMLGRNGAVTVCFFGEGAMAEGEFHEAMNLAALWNVPVLFCCENNRYAMGTSLKSSESQVDLALKAASYALPAWVVDGMDVMEVHRATTKALTAPLTMDADEPMRMGSLSSTPVVGRCSSGSRPTGSAHTRCSTPICTAIQPRSNSGSSATRSRRSPTGSSPTG